MNNPFGKADIALIVIIIAILGAVWAFNMDSYTPTQFCQDAAVAAEGNLSRGYTDVTCRCESPERYMRSINATTPGKVLDVTDIRDVLVCDTNEFEDSMVFPLLQINETKYNQSGGITSLNQSVLNGQGFQQY